MWLLCHFMQWWEWSIYNFNVISKVIKIHVFWIELMCDCYVFLCNDRSEVFIISVAFKKLEKFRYVWLNCCVIVTSFYTMMVHVYRLQNHFVRHNTPHPKELKARHPKVFSKTKDVDGHVIPHNPEKKAEVNSPDMCMWGVEPTFSRGRGISASDAVFTIIWRRFSAPIFRLKKKLICFCTTLVTLVADWHCSRLSRSE